MNPAIAPQRRIPVLILCMIYLVAMCSLLFQFEMGAAQGLVILPLALMGLYFAVYHFTQFLRLLVFSIPMSVSIKDLGGGFGASFPVEAMLGLAAILAGIMVVQGKVLRKSVLLHPLTLLIGAQVLWSIITTVTSTHTLISSKFVIARLTYLLVFYFLFANYFHRPKEIIRFLWLYLTGFVPVMLFSLIQLGGMGFSRQFSPAMSEPFYDDHTVFGACVGLLLPTAILLMWHRKELLAGFRWNRLIYLAMPLSVMSLFLSFSRAAWLSVIAALAMRLLMRVRISFGMILFALGLVAGGVYLNQDALLDRMRANKSASGEDVLTTAASVTNVTTDESNKERVNRWASALRMHEDRPWVGFGPGTYEHKYGTYQISSEKTRISTINGDRGDAHSEYLGVLSEQGLPGLLIQFTLFLLILRTGMRVAYRNAELKERILALAITLGMVTYFLHGAVNSFLDIDKAASLFWGMASMLVVLDLLEKKRGKTISFD